MYIDKNTTNKCENYIDCFNIRNWSFNPFHGFLDSSYV